MTALWESIDALNEARSLRHINADCIMPNFFHSSATSFLRDSLERICLNRSPALPLPSAFFFLHWKKFRLRTLFSPAFPLFLISTVLSRFLLRTVAGQEIIGGVTTPLRERLLQDSGRVFLCAYSFFLYSPTTLSCWLMRTALITVPCRPAAPGSTKEARAISSSVKKLIKRFVSYRVVSLFSNYKPPFAVLERCRVHL